MRTCQYCGMDLPNQAVFCGECGRAQSALIPQDADDEALYAAPPTTSHTGKQQVVQRTPPHLAPGSSYVSSPGIMHVGGGMPTQPFLDHPSLQGFTGGQAPLVLSQKHAIVMPPPGYTVSQPDLYYNHYVQQPPQHRKRSGCLGTLSILALLLLVVVGSVIGTGLFIFKPSLTITSNGTIYQGGNFQLHGTSFVPGDRITLNLDYTTPLLTNDAISVGSDSTFNVKIPVDNSWRVGMHTITATEGFSPRSASTTLTVYQPGQGPSTGTPGAQGTTTPTPTLSGTPLPGTPGLSSISPAAVTLGPTPSHSGQTISTPVTLNTAGDTEINWTATWDAVQAPWLVLNPSSGTIQEPESQSLLLDGLAETMAAGTYTTVIHFSSPQSSTSLALNVTFIVQSGSNTTTGCQLVIPTALNFTGIVNQSNPVPQNLQLNACGQSGSWSTTISGINTSWLSITPASGTITIGETQTISVLANNVGTALATGTYEAAIVFTSNNGTVTTVPVTLTVRSN